MWLPWILLGLIIGWVLHVLAHDYFWRDRRICTDKEINLQKSVDQLETQTIALNGQIGDLNQAAQARDTRIHALSGDLDMRNAQIGDLTASLEAKDAEIGRTNIQLGALQMENIAFNDQVASLKGDLDTRDAELSGLRGQLGSVDAELQGWGLGALAGGGLLALRQRFNNMRRDLDAKDAEIGDLRLSAEGNQATLAALSADLDAKDTEISNLQLSAEGNQATLATLSADLDAKNAQIDALNADIASRDSEIDSLRVELADVRNELDGLQIDGAAGVGSGLGIAALINWLRNRNRTLETNVADRDSQLMALNSQFKTDLDDMTLAKGAADARVDQLEAALAAKDTQIDDLNAQLGTLNADLTTRDASLGELNLQVESLNSDLAARNSELEGLNLQLGDLNADLATRDSELETLRVQMAEANSQLEGLEIDIDGAAAGAGAGLGLGGLIGWLRNRNQSLESGVADRDSQLMALNAKYDADIEAVRVDTAGYNARIGELETSLAARTAEVEGLHAQIGAKSAEFDNLNLQLGSLNADLATRDSELEALRLQMAEANSQFEGLDIDIDDATVGAGAGLGLAGLIGWLRNRNQSLESDMADRDAQLVALNAKYDMDIEAVRIDTSGYDARIGELEASLATRTAEVEGLNAQIGAKSAEFDNLNLQLGNLNADLATRDSRIVELEGQVKEAADNAEMAELYSAEVDTLRVDLAARDSELEALRLQIAEANSQLDGLEIDGAGAGAGLGLAGLIGWLRNRTQSLESDIADRDSQLLALNTKYDADIGAAKVNTDTFGLRIGELEAALAERDAALLSLQTSKPDDLTEISGIGPKFAKALNAGGITTYAQLAAMDDSEITTMLEAAGVNYRLAAAPVRATWQEQAKLLASGDLVGLSQLQSQLKRGGAAGGLGKVWGIGSKVTGLLAAVGVTNYSELASSSTADIDDALNAAQGYYPGMTKAQIHQSWVEQSSMAANGQWGLLKGYKARFRRGRQADDLTRIWGIGPKTAKVLDEHGIDTFVELADASIEQIGEILEEAGTNFNFSTDTLLVNWKRMARLASINDWENFQTLYDQLSWENQQDRS